MTNTRALTLILLLLAGLALGIMFPGESSAVFTSYDVNTTADDPGITMTACTVLDPPGACSLRGAINRANNHAGSDGVSFHIATGVQTISLMSPLEPITDAVVIDGTTQQFHGQSCISAFGKPCIVVNGSAAGANANGLDLATQGITVKGLAIVGFKGTGIRSENASGNITIVRNFIGTADGIIASPNGTGIFAAADNPNYVIGGTTAAERNVISGNTGTGIIAGSGTPINHVILGNFIGVTASGSGDLGNGGDGIEVSGPHTVGGTDSGARNVISGNSGAGVRMFSNENVLQGNLIGTSADGLSAIPNNVGVYVDYFAGGTIGGTEAGARNVVSGNNSFGIEMEIQNGSVVNVQGNYIGLDVTGAALLGNAGDGIHVAPPFGNTGGVTIGGPEAGARNIITGNNSGVVMTDGGVSGATVQNNFIGLNAAGTATVGNQAHGVTLFVNGHVSENNKFIGNVFAGNDSALELDATGAGGELRNNVVSGNLVGLNAAGTQVLPNREAILIFTGLGGTAHDNMIDDSESPNRVSGNDAGVELFGAGTHDNTARGNMIDGNGVGVLIGPGVPHNVIESNTISGSATDGISVGAGAHDMVFQSNTISANVRDGFLINPGANHITIDSNTITKNLVGIVSRGDNIIVQRNFIGTNKHLDPGLGNAGAGVFLSGDSNTVGGEVLGGRSAGDARPEAAAAGQGNVILNNGGSGVDMESGTHNSVSRNSIDNNGDIGIKLEGTSNNNEPAPALTSAKLENARTHIQGSLTSSGFFPFTIEFFASPFCDLSGTGEGRDYLGFVTVGASPAAIDGTVAAAAPGKVVTATATSDDYNTSQFSNCVTVTGSTPSPSPTPSGSPSHTPTATPRSTIKGDANCDGHVTSADVLATLSESVHVDPGADCANLANVDCDQDVDAFDALRILDYVAQAPLPQGTECPPIGV